MKLQLIAAIVLSTLQTVSATFNPKSVYFNTTTGYLHGTFNNKERRIIHSITPRYFSNGSALVHVIPLGDKNWLSKRGEIETRDFFDVLGTVCYPFFPEKI